ncbi:YjbF family lipoprotein [Sulfitobacter sp. D35]|uniref:YjbF family lipoprotein n=1 Tax=Sulfitobacter sp. D35 TaxID=3083252 RepID=UPI00296EB7F3|nr:YjbF family lipoprotein [Sulfitobacter sp. D35]MDW4498215.1 YjbF family lipoprotein [Sulfitobacter sp. D35]
MVARMELMQKSLKALGAALSLLVLSACSSGDEALSNYDFMRQTVTQVASQQGRGEPKPLKINRRLLDNTKEAVLMGTPEITGQAALLRRVARRNDPYPGTLEVWLASNAAQVSFRDGVVVGSKGLGADIQSSDVSQTLSRLAARQSGPTRKQLHFIRGDNAPVVVNMSCNMADLGAESVTIVDQTFPVRHFRESCEAEGAPFVYDYWLDYRSGLIRKSRQWMGPSNDYFEFVLLKS